MLKSVVSRMSNYFEEQKKIAHTRKESESSKTKEFFSETQRESETKPLSEENERLKQRLQVLQRARSAGGAVALNELMQMKSLQQN